MTIWVWYHEAGRCMADDAIEWGGEDTPEYIPDCDDSFPGRWRKFHEEGDCEGEKGSAWDAADGVGEGVNYGCDDDD